MRHRRAITVCLFLTLAFAGHDLAYAGADEAYDFLDRMMDEYILDFGVFTELGSAGNHFAARCATVRDPEDPADLAAVAFDETWSEGCHGDDGGTCVRNTFAAIDNGYWGGFYFLNGTLDGDEVRPSCNWGDVPDAGFDLRGATKLTFWAKGETGDEQIEIFVGGTGWDPIKNEKVKPFAESFHRVPGVGTIIDLTTEWTEHTIDLSAEDLSYVLSGIAWVASASNNPDGAVFYLDDISFDLARPEEPRLLRSFQTLPGPPLKDFDTILKNVAWIYDNSVALLAYLHRSLGDDLDRARILADALVYALHHDRYFDDGRLRNAYQAGDLILPPGWTPHGRIATARMPGRWDPPAEEWVEDKGQVGTSTGNVGWAMLALLRAYQVLGDASYLDAARTLGEWVESHVRPPLGSTYIGYTGGYEGWIDQQTQFTWKSTEHNLDLYVAFMLLYDLTGEPVWRDRALNAKAFVRAMWEACEPEHFAAGALDDGVTPNCDFFPVDVNTWGLMALGEAAKYSAGVRWAATAARVTEPCFAGDLATGLDFNDDRDGIWWEGTAHTAIAADILRADQPYSLLTANLTQAQSLAPRADGEGLVATCHDGVTTGIDGFLFYNRLHVGATAWYAMAMEHHNPFWGIDTGDPIPHEGE